MTFSELKKKAIEYGFIYNEKDDIFEKLKERKGILEMAEMILIFEREEKDIQ